MTDLIKRLREADTYNKKYYAVDPLHQEAADRIEELNERLTAATDDAKEAEAYAEQLEERNKELALQLLAVHGQAADALEKLTKAVEALVAEREANLWNAYNIGIERDGRWSDACMSDAEWLVAQCGLDPEFKDHDANVIKETIPIAARAVLAELEGK